VGVQFDNDNGWDMESQSVKIIVDPVLILWWLSLTVMLADIWRAGVLQSLLFVVVPVLVLWGFSLTMIMAGIWRARVLKSLLIQFLSCGGSV
jgi:hypothetical protein